MMKHLRKTLFILLIASVLLTMVMPAFAQSSKFERPRTRYLGDVRATMKRIQQLPGILDHLLCENDPEFYMAERQRLTTEIENLKWLLTEMDIKHNLDLQSIISAVNYYNTCGEGKYATGIADREWNKLMKLLVRYGLQ